MEAVGDESRVGAGVDRASGGGLTQGLRGLTATEVAERRARGEANDVPLATSRPYRRIFLDNALTPINVVLYVIAALLLGLGRPGDAVTTAGLIALNVLVGIVQEGRAKRQLDRLALLTRPRACVLRDGEEHLVDPSEVVRGDVLILRPGDQAVVDGPILRAAGLRLDESLLTGEADPVAKHPGEIVYSGSVCVAGSAVIRADAVGRASRAQRITARARAFRNVQTPLQREVNGVIRAMAVMAMLIGIGAALSYYREFRHLAVVQSVQAAAVIVGLVPQGLSAMTTVTYAMAALRMAGKGAVIQRINAVESTSHVDVLCLDKTGTLTTNQLEVREVRALAPGLDAAAARALLGRYAASVTVANRTVEALRAACPSPPDEVLEEVPFSSSRKWSALVVRDEGRPRTLVLGAPDVLSPRLAPAGLELDLAEEWASGGLRVLLLAESPGLGPPPGPGADAAPGEPLAPLALLSVGDVLRPEARRTVAELAQAGVAVKLISGDHPDTVAALAEQVGIAGTGQRISGLALDDAGPAQLRALVETTTIFGRVSPEQKADLVDALRANGHYVAMIGDGVNDVLALKQADLAVAMEDGSAVTRGVADLVLLGSSFAALPPAFLEGQRILRGMQDIIRLFLARTLSLALVIVVVALLGAPFPTSPKQNNLVALVTVGIPTLALALWARPGLAPRRILPSTARFVVPAALTIAGVLLTTYLFFLDTTGDALVARTALTLTAILCGITLIPFAQPPSPAWVGGVELRGDRKPLAVAVAMLGLSIASLTWPTSRAFFELRLLPRPGYAMVALAVLGWASGLRFLWRLDSPERLRAFRQRLRRR